MTDPDSQAFPDPQSLHRTGLTKREYFAIRILQAIISNNRTSEVSGEQILESVLCADALILGLNGLNE